MDFATAFSTLEIGDYAAVSDGKPAPSATGGLAWFMWRSHNFVGRLIGKSGSTPHRRMTFELAPQEGATIAYTIAEGVGHNLSPSNLAGFLAG